MTHVLRNRLVPRHPSLSAQSMHSNHGYQQKSKCVHMFCHFHCHVRHKYTVNLFRKTFATYVRLLFRQWTSIEHQPYQ